MQRINLTGKRFGALTAICPVSAADTNDHRPGWLVRCDCGNEKIVNGSNLRRGLITSCGCGMEKHRRQSITMIEKDGHERLEGMQFYELTAEQFLGHNKWRWRCSCGKQTVAKAADVKNGIVQSCGHILAQTAKRKMTEQNVVGHYDGTLVSRIKHIMASPTVRGIRAIRGANGNIIAWRASITLRRKEIYIGRYPTKDEAEAARRRAENKYYLPIINEYESKKEKITMPDPKLLPLVEYAAKVGRDPASIRQRILRGNFPSAVKMGRNWFVPEDAPYDDNRVTSGKYIDVKRNR